MILQLTSHQDFSVLLIAIHTALVIFRGNSAGQAGLYNYRKTAYLSSFLCSVLLASLAFLNPDHAYVATGIYCYLPVRPIWYRLALSWIPRYFIFIIILGISLAIFCYVRRMLRGVRADSEQVYGVFPEGLGKKMATGNILAGHVNPDHGITATPMPHLVHNGLLDSSNSNLIKISGRRQPSHWSSMATLNTTGDLNRVDIPISSVYEGWSSSDTEHAIPDTSADAKEETIPSPSGIRTNGNPSEVPSSRRLSVVSTTNTITSLIHKRHEESMNTKLLPDQLISPPSSIAAAVLTDGPRDSRTFPSSQSTVRQRHILIERQMRFVFIYPFAYMVMWIPSFVQNAMRYTDRYSRNPEFWLSSLVTFVLAAQCAVDCWLFCWREGMCKGWWTKCKVFVSLRKKRLEEANNPTNRNGEITDGLEMNVRKASKDSNVEAAKPTLGRPNEAVKKEVTNWWDVDPRYKVDGLSQVDESRRGYNEDV